MRKMRKDVLLLEKLLLSLKEPWTINGLSELLFSDSESFSIDKTEEALLALTFLFPILTVADLFDENESRPKMAVINAAIKKAIGEGRKVCFVQDFYYKNEKFMVWNCPDGVRRWLKFEQNLCSDLSLVLEKIIAFEKSDVLIVPHGPLVGQLRPLLRKWGTYEKSYETGQTVRIAMEIYNGSPTDILLFSQATNNQKSNKDFTHLEKLEAESIHIMREVVAEAENPAMLYSLGKDSSVMLHLARKAFYPSRIPFPLMHVDTLWKFNAMYQFRDFVSKHYDVELQVFVNPDGKLKNINPIEHGSSTHTNVMKTQALKLGLDKYGYDIVFGGARRDEEKSRSKERIFSFRKEGHIWDPKNQRPEVWNIYNCKKMRGESIRVFPLSNWTELDIWQYIYRENIPIVPLYFAAERPVVERDNMMIMLDDDRLPLDEHDEIKIKKIRFRSLGCYPLTGAIESEADDISSIILEVISARNSEREGRGIDSDYNSSMEKKKLEGYF